MNRNQLIVVFNGNVEGHRLPAIPPDFEGDIVVNGDISVDKHIILPKARLWVSGSILIEGDLEICSVIAEEIDCYNLTAQDVYCYGEMDTANIIVGGNCTCIGIIRQCNIVDVLDDFTCQEVDSSEYIFVGGNLTVNNGDCTADDLIVHGNVNVSDNIEALNVTVSGNVTCCDFTCSYTTKISGDLKCDDITAGNMNIAGDLMAKHTSCEHLNVKSFELEGEKNS